MAKDDWRDKRKPLSIGIDLGEPAGDKSVNVVMMSTPGNPDSWVENAFVRRGWSIVGEVPPEAGKLVSSTVFHGMLWLAFEGGLWCVMGGKLRKVTIDNG